MSAGFRGYIIKRILISIPMIFLLVTAVFFVMHVLPGDPVLAIMGEKITYEQYLELRRLWGLDVPLHIQFLNYWSGLLTGNLGISSWNREPVMIEISSRFPVTIELSVIATGVSLLVGFGLGLIGALKRNKAPDFILRFVSMGGYSVPGFWIGMLFQLFVAIYLTGLLPIAGLNDPRIYIQKLTGFNIVDSIISLNMAGLIDSLKHLILPALTLSVFNVALINRIARSNIIEVLDQDYIQTARAKGMREIKVLSKHATKNAMLPIITVMAMNFARMLGGVLVTETVFSIPGMGRLLVESVDHRDFAMIQGVIIIFGISVIIVATVLDLVYAYLDPRIRYR